LRLLTRQFEIESKGKKKIKYSQQKPSKGKMASKAHDRFSLQKTWIMI